MYVCTYAYRSAAPIFILYSAVQKLQPIKF
jgi:hypothetical protein